MRSLSYQRKADDLFFPELLVNIIIGIFKAPSVFGGYL
jgi:hypothetical protein